MAAAASACVGKAGVGPAALLLKCICVAAALNVALRWAAAAAVADEVLLLLTPPLPGLPASTPPLGDAMGTGPGVGPACEFDAGILYMLA